MISSSPLKYYFSLIDIDMALNVEWVQKGCLDLHNNDISIQEKRSG